MCLHIIMCLLIYLNTTLPIAIRVICFFLSHTHNLFHYLRCASKSIIHWYNARVAMVVMTVSIIIVRHDFYAPCLMFCVSLSPTLLCITRPVTYWLYHSPIVFFSALSHTQWLLLQSHTVMSMYLVKSWQCILVCHSFNIHWWPYFDCCVISCHDFISLWIAWVRAWLSWAWLYTSHTRTLTLFEVRWKSTVMVLKWFFLYRSCQQILPSDGCVLWHACKAAKWSDNHIRCCNCTVIIMFEYWQLVNLFNDYWQESSNCFSN